MRKRDKTPIVKNLEAEAELQQDIACLPMAGANQAENFRSPDFYVFLLFEKCSGVHAVDFVSYKQRNLQIHISFPGQLHSWQTGADALGYKLLVSRRMMERSIFSSQFSYLTTNKFPVIDIDRSTFNRLAYEFAAVHADLEKEPSDLAITIARTQLIVAIVNQLVLEKAEEADAHIQTPALLTKFFKLIDEDFRELKSVTDYAARLFVTPNYLSILCKRHLGVNAKKIIDKRVALEAKRLLLGSDITIKEIAYMLGFKEMSSFSHFMKINTGMPPSGYRKRKGGTA